jgi:hypothetical protein
MSRKAPIRFFCWKVSCGLIHCLNALLAAIALLQTALVLLNNVQREVPLPEGLTRWIVQFGLGDEFRASWNRAVFDLRGGLYLEDLNLLNAHSDEFILDAETLSINWAPVNLLFGIFPPFEDLQATGIQLYTPSSHSPSGLNEPVLEINHARLREHDGQLLIDELLATSGGVRVVFSGSGPFQFPTPKPGQPAAVNRIPSLLSDILRLHRQVDVDCRVHWTWTKTGSHSLSLFALSDSLVLPELSLQHLIAEARLESDGSSLSLVHLTLNGSLASIDLGTDSNLLSALPLDLPVPVSVVASGPPRPVRWGAIPSQLSVLIRNPFSQQIPIDVFHLESALLGPEPAYHWSAKGRGFFANGTAHPFLPSPPASPQPDFPFGFSFRAYIHQPALADFFPGLPDHRLINGANARFIRFTGFTTPDNRLLGSLVSDELYVGETSFSHIRAQLNLSRSDLLLSQVHVQKTVNESATGSYYHHFPSSQFALNARGRIFPQSLDALLGRWWKQIFTQIQANEPLSGDVTVWGQWRDEKSLRSVTAVEGSGASYREIAVPALRVQVRSNGEWAYLNELEARFGDRQVTGEIAWQQGLEDTVRRPVKIRFRSDAPWPVVQQASGVDALQELELGGNPEVYVEGTLWRPSRDAEPEAAMIPDLRLSLRNPDAVFKVSGLDLYSMRFEGKLIRESLSLKSVSGILAEGVFTGRIDIRNWADPERQERYLQLQVFDARYTEAVRQVSGLLKDPEMVHESLFKEEEGGRIDADIDLLIKPESTASRGHGRITLRNGRIGEIHIFGGLSRALNAMGLGFSTMDLNAASLEWSLQDGILAIPQCLVTGPVLNLRLYGDLNVVNDQLSMQAEAYFFQGLMSKVLTPVSDNFLFDVTGTLANPSWQLRLNPLRWFQNRFSDGIEAEPVP